MQKIIYIFGSRYVLGLLIAAMSVFTAVSSYQNVTLDSKANDTFSHAQEKLAFADSEYLSSTQEIMQDQNLYHGFSIALLKNEKDIADYYRSNFSDELQNSITRPNGPFDAEYYNTMVADAESGTDEALQLFTKANATSDAADCYAQTMLIFSVGLTLTAWGSLFDNHPEIRAIFCIIALALLAFGAALFFHTPSTP